MMEIRKTYVQDFQCVRDFYHELIDTSDYVPMWEKDVFPDNDYLMDAVSNGELFAGYCGGKMVASIVFRCEGEVAHINLLGVLPAYTRKGLARQLVAFAISQAEADNCKAVRLSVLDGNTAAERLYLSMGFKQTDTFEEYYERTGRMVFRVYEYVI